MRGGGLCSQDDLFWHTHSFSLLSLLASGTVKHKLSSAGPAASLQQHMLPPCPHSSSAGPPPPHPAVRARCRRLEGNSKDWTGTGVSDTNSLLAVSTKFARLSLCMGGGDLSRCVSGGENLHLASWPSADHLQYICPSQKLSTMPDLVILEDSPFAVLLELPQAPALISSIINPACHTMHSEISEPSHSPTNAPKEAREIMKIRRKKMKRHLLKKFRKRMAFTLRKMKRDRRKKKEAVFQARLASIKDWGDSFSARDWVQEELEKARKGGFYINVLAKKQ